MIHLRASFNFLCCSEDWRHLPRTDYCPAPADPLYYSANFRGYGDDESHFRL